MYSMINNDCSFQQTTEMATKDLEKYYKVLDRYTKLHTMVLPAQPAVTVSTQTSGSQSHHALPQTEDGRDQ